MSPQLDKLFSLLYSFDTESFQKELPKLKKDELDQENKQRLTLLHLAASKGLKDPVIALLSKGANPNHFNKTHLSPLHAALDADSGRIVKLMIIKGIEPDILSNAKNYAEQKQQKEMLDILNTPKEIIHEKLIARMSEEAFATLDKRVKQHSKTEEDTPIQDDEIDQKATLEEETKTNIDPMDEIPELDLDAIPPKQGLAMFEHFDAMNYDVFMRDLAFFVKSGADINLREPKKGLTLLMKAVQDGGSRQTKALLQAGANANLEDDYGISTLQYAAKGESPGCLNAIIAKLTADSPHLEKAISFLTMKGDEYQETVDELKALAAQSKSVAKAETAREIVAESPSAQAGTEQSQASYFTQSNALKLVGGLTLAAGGLYLGSLLFQELFPSPTEAPETKQERKQQLGFFANSVSRPLFGMDIVDNTCPVQPQ